MVTTGVPPGRFNRLFIKLHLTKAFSNSKRKYLNFCTYSVYVRLNPHLQFAQLLLEFPLLNLSGGGTVATAQRGFKYPYSLRDRYLIWFSFQLVNGP
jgi:hypothetical protein